MNKLQEFATALSNQQVNVTVCILLLLDWFEDQVALTRDFELDALEPDAKPLTQNGVATIVATHFGRSVSGMRQWLDFQAQLGPTWYRQTRNMWLWPSLSVVSFHEQ